jgi:hypothetical protein
MRADWYIKTVLTLIMLALVLLLWKDGGSWSSKPKVARVDTLAITSNSDADLDLGVDCVTATDAEIGAYVRRKLKIENIDLSSVAGENGSASCVIEISDSQDEYGFYTIKAFILRFSYE